MKKPSELRQGDGLSGAIRSARGRKVLPYSLSVTERGPVEQKHARLPFQLFQALGQGRRLHVHPVCIIFRVQSETSIWGASRK